MSMFNDAAIDRAVDEALSKVPVGHTNAIIAHVDLNGAQLAIVVKANDTWQFKGYADRKWTGELGAGAEVIASF